MRRPRVDALPEHFPYRDTGCDIHPVCLTCPLPRCRYDDPRGARGLINLLRDQEIVDLRQRGLPVDVVALRYSVSRRTVFRIMSKTRLGERRAQEPALRGAKG